jgi:ribosomal protein L7Ae-like RNA K-turn-binding protein
MKDSGRLIELVKELEQKRKNREISALEFYRGLLEVLSQLKDVLLAEDISEANVRKQIPLLLTFIKSQIGEMEKRGN